MDEELYHAYFHQIFFHLEGVETSCALYFVRIIDSHIIKKI